MSVLLLPLPCCLTCKIMAVLLTRSCSCCCCCSLFLQEHGRFEDEDFYEEFAKPPADRNIPALEFMREEAVKVWEEFGQLPDRCHY